MFNALLSFIIPLLRLNMHLCETVILFHRFVVYSDCICSSKIVNIFGIILPCIYMLSSRSLAHFCYIVVVVSKNFVLILNEALFRVLFCTCCS